MGGRSRGAAKPAAAGEAGDGRPLSTDDNRKAVEEAERAQLISALSTIKAQKVKTAEAKKKYDEERDAETELFRRAKVAGFERAELSELLTDSGARTKDLLAAEVRRKRLRQHAGLPTTDDAQPDLLDRQPQEAKDELAWRLDGYRAGLLAKSPTPPSDCPTRFHPVFTAGWHDGDAINKSSAEAVKNAPPAPPTPIGKVGAAEPPADPDGFEMTAEEREAQVGRVGIREGHQTDEQLAALQGEKETV